MRSERAGYEVRCPRCDVTFPIGTRTCVHCGGSTVASNETPEISIESLPSFDFGSTGDRDSSEPKIRSRERVDADSARSSNPRSGPLEDLESEEEAPGAGRSILGSMGSLIWIALLIAFSLSGRMCGE